MALGMCSMMIGSITKRWCAAWGLLAVAGGIPCPIAGADVVINEIMYHPPSDLDADEFLELVNTGPDPVNLDGWCIDGVTFCFDSPTTIPADGFIVVAKDAAAFEATYGFAPDHVYEGRLSNAGETLQLIDAAQVVRDAVTYDDVGAWPPLADGEGPSLERIDPTLDADTPRNWHAAVDPDGHTAGAVNSVFASGLPPWISEVAFTTDPLPEDDIPVTARVEDADTVVLVYLVDFGDEVTMSMHDDGAHGDGDAGDLVYGATIPAQAAASLVRFRIEADGPAASIQYPRDDDTINYDGTMVTDPALASDLPIVHWFIDPVDYDAALAHFLTDELEPAALYYNGTLYDNIRIRVRGQLSRYWVKKHWKFRFPQGHDFTAPDLFPIPVDQFNMQSNYSDKSYVREILAYEAFRLAGSVYNIGWSVRLQQNGTFFGLYTLLESMDDDYVTRHGLDEQAAWYKAYDDCRYRVLADLPNYYEKKTREEEGYEDLEQFLYHLRFLGSADRRLYIYDNVDIPGMLNYLAVTCIIHNNDHPAKNFFLYRDTEGTQRWVMQPWDMDLTLGRNFGAGGGVLSDGIWADNDDVGRANVSPSHPLFGDRYHQKYDFLWNRIIDGIYEHPDFREMYFRRLRTLVDELLADGFYESLIAERTAAIGPEAELDRARWGQYGEPQTLTEAVDLILADYLPRRRQHLRVTHRVPGEIPDAQTTNLGVVINEIMYHPAGDPNAEFVELYNLSAREAVDLSGWQLRGTGLTFPPGTVLLPHSYLIVVRDDVTSRATYGTGLFTPAQYPGALENAGERLVLVDRFGTEMDSVEYDDVTPWPPEPDGGGPSLERIVSWRDDRRVANWAASVSAGGTPCGPNSVAGTIPAIPDLFINEVLPNNQSTLADEQGEFEPWIEIYNASGTTVDLSGMFLTNDFGSPTQWMIPAGTTLCGGTFLLVWADAEPGDGPLHANFSLASGGGSVALYLADGTIADYIHYPALDADEGFGLYPDGNAGRYRLTPATPGLRNADGSTLVVLNEYNAVDPGQFLENEGVDTYWGRTLGNGGDWFELAVTRHHVDMRGWQLEVRNEAGSPQQQEWTLELTDDPLWADLRAGTIITVSEDLPDDPSYDPWNDDWWINVQAATGGSGAYISPTGFTVSNNDWQLTIRDADGAVVFGPAGEGIEPASGIGGDEVAVLADDPGPFVSPRSNYRDESTSTFGAPNRHSAASGVQDFSPLRSQFEPCQDAGDCDDGNDCTVDECFSDECVHTPFGPCYELRLNLPDAAPDGSVPRCSLSDLTVTLDLTGVVQPVNGLQVLLEYDPALLTLDAISPGDGQGSPWDAAVVLVNQDDDGDVVYALLLAGAETSDDATVATMHFTVRDVAGSTRVAFSAGCAPFETKVTRAADNTSVHPGMLDSGEIHVDVTLPDCGITAAESVRSGSSGNIASVADAGIDASYLWTVTGGTLDAGQGTVSILYTAGEAGDVTLDVTVAEASGCEQACDTVVPIVACGVDVECDDGNPCTTDICTNGACQYAVLPDGTPCPDGDTCNGDEFCESGVCMPGDGESCDDGVDCTDDVCDPELGCVYIPDDTRCDDGAFCNGQETCDAVNGCQLGVNPCDQPELPVCDEVDDRCVECLDDTDCDDGSFCTGAEICLDNACVVGPVPCGDDCELCDEAAEQCAWCVYDLDGNGAIASGDFNFFAGCYGACYAPAEPCFDANFDGDAGGCVASGDFSGFSFCYGQLCSGCSICWPGLDGFRTTESPGDAATLRLVAVPKPTPYDTAMSPPESQRVFLVARPVHVELWASRSDNAPTGFAAVHADVISDPGAVAWEGVAPADDFSLFPSGDLEPSTGTVRGVGGCTMPGELAVGAARSWTRVASMRVCGKAVGVTRLDVRPPDDPRGVAVVGEPGNLPPDSIQCQGVTVEFREAVPETAGSVQSGRSPNANSHP
jgi:hypothetical protein